MKLPSLMLVKQCIVIMLLIAGLYGCCISFNSLTNGAEFPVGSVVNTNGEQISIEQFQTGGGWSSDGIAEIHNRNWSGGTGLDIGAGNTNLHFLFEYPVSNITLKFGDLGGNSNIKVNNEFQNLNSLPDISGSILDGVTVTVNAYQQGANWYGELILDGVINDFAIGGQELWIDDICKKK